MDTEVVILELPVSLYNKLQKLAVEEQTDPVEIIARLVSTSTQSAALPQTQDPVFELIGAYHSQHPLIDDIPVSEDPDLYLAAEALGDKAWEMHAWDIAPSRYRQGPDGRPVRRDVDEAQA
jgi:hypothetical protein